MAPGGNNDFGLDAFYFEERESETTLHLIQAKFSSNVNYVKSGFTGFRKLVPHLQKMISGTNDSVNQNCLLDRLHAQLQKRSASIPAIKFYFEVVHLNREGERWLGSTLTSAEDTLGTTVETLLGALNYGFMQIYAGGSTTPLPDSHSYPIRFQGEQLRIQPNVEYLQVWADSQIL